MAISIVKRRAQVMQTSSVIKRLKQWKNLLDKYILYTYVYIVYSSLPIEAFHGPIIH
jgi:hypothetical protein